MTLPSLLPKKPRRSSRVRCPSHLRWVRSFRCCVPGCKNTDIQAAHVRKGTDGSTAEKPSDRWAISLCSHHHDQQHLSGEVTFEGWWNINLKALAEEFARKSPHRRKLEGK